MYEEKNKRGIVKATFTLEGMKISGLQSKSSIIKVEEELSAMSLFKYVHISVFLCNSHHFAVSLLTSSDLDVKSCKLVT